VTVSESSSPGGTTRRWLHAALDVPPEERRAFLEEHLPLGPSRDEALALIAEVDDLGTFLESPPPRRSFVPALPERIGDYAIERVLGWG